jgi:hypothetical protein
MILYHASQKQFAVLKRNQATMVDGVVVPEAEVQNKIYLTPSFGFALAMAAGPDGMTHLDEETISFERADEFNPEAVIYVYTIDGHALPPESLEYIDENQYAADVDELIPAAIATYLAKEVFKYYKQVDFKLPSQQY